MHYTQLHSELGEQKSTLWSEKSDQNPAIVRRTIWAEKKYGVAEGKPIFARCAGNSDGLTEQTWRAARMNQYCVNECYCSMDGACGRHLHTIKCATEMDLCEMRSAGPECSAGACARRGPHSKCWARICTQLPSQKQACWANKCRCRCTRKMQGEKGGSAGTKRKSKYCVSLINFISGR